jgi:hypothetical protein
MILSSRCAVNHQLVCRAGQNFGARLKSMGKLWNYVQSTRLVELHLNPSKSPESIERLSRNKIFFVLSHVQLICSGRVSAPFDTSKTHPRSIRQVPEHLPSLSIVLCIWCHEPGQESARIATAAQPGLMDAVMWLCSKKSNRLGSQNWDLDLKFWRR